MPERRYYQVEIVTTLRGSSLALKTDQTLIGDSSSMFRFAMRIAGALAIVLIFFFGTLLTLDWWNTLPYPDSVRAEHASSIKAALERYRAARGHYPAPFGDNPLTDLKNELVDGHFVAAIPKDPIWGLGEKQYRYVSVGEGYGLLFHLQYANGKIPEGGSCITGVATQGWWGNPPFCPF
jgi:hypothetical protein